jgi:hypothetical protein
MKSFGYKPCASEAPPWADSIVLVEDDPEIWYFAKSDDGKYFVFDDYDIETLEPLIMYTGKSIIKRIDLEIANMV